MLKVSESTFFTDATDATFAFTPSPEADPALGSFGVFKINTLQGSAVGTLFTPPEDLAKELKTTKTTTLNWSTIDLSKELVLDAEVVLSGKQNKITVTFFQPKDGALVGALVGDVAAGYTGFTRTVSFTWSPA